MNDETFNTKNAFSINKIASEFVTSIDVCNRYGVTTMTLWRWLNNDNVNFPKPIYINRRRYFRISDVLEWESKREKGAAN